MISELCNTRVTSVATFKSPREIKRMKSSEFSQRIVAEGRQEVSDVLSGKSNRMIVIVGPCSIHERTPVIKYARKLAVLRHIYKEKLCILMRAYFEKPRTTIGWKGLVSDPYLDNSFKIDDGACLARAMLCEITRRGLPVATEFVSDYTPQFLDDLVSWSAIGARTVESPSHREMASGLSMPVGFKNGTGGDVQVAVDAIKTASTPHYFCGVDESGRGTVFATTGNPDGHLVLRGGKNGPNYEPSHIAHAVQLLRASGLNERIIVDCSHANAAKDYRLQSRVLRSVVEQRNAGSKALVGVMIESYLVEGKQDIRSSPLVKGQSITDACVGWTETEEMLAEMYETLIL